MHFDDPDWNERRVLLQDAFASAAEQLLDHMGPVEEMQLNLPNGRRVEVRILYGPESILQ
jgi:hypothetical protein